MLVKLAGITWTDKTASPSVFLTELAKMSVIQMTVNFYFQNGNKISLYYEEMQNRSINIYYYFLRCLGVYPFWNATKIISLDSVGPTESSGIHFVAFQTGRIFKIKIKRNLKIAQNRRSGALLRYGPNF